jgi:hypothetical protein
MTKDEALRLALEALEDETNEKYCPAITAIKAALEAKDEPFMASYEHKQYGYYKDESGSLKLGDIPQRKWVGLTDIDYAGLPLEQVGLVRWAEAKLKEKNK